MSDPLAGAALLALCLLGAALLTGAIRRGAVRRGMLDRPNERSSHTVPTPRGGGLAIVIVTVLATAAGIGLGWIPARIGLALLPGYLLIAWIGWLDDRSGVPAALRLVVHLVAAAWMLLVTIGFPIPVNAAAALAGVGALAFLWIAVAWATNLFNFMDGTDGIAASQAVFVGLAGALVASLQGAPVLSLLLAVVAGGAGGFLIWNWQPAKIFMGDVGSGSLGFLLAAAPIAALGVGIEALWPWVILWSAFAVDATVTLVRRALGRQRIFDAHRSHAYQILSRRWQSHARVALAYGAVNIGWLMPIALVAAVFPQTGPLLAGLAALPLVLVALRIGAGRPDA
jgi:Fuc2NAc and GlcNAc transferase